MFSFFHRDLVSQALMRISSSDENQDLTYKTSQLKKKEEIRKAEKNLKNLKCYSLGMKKSIIAIKSLEIKSKNVLK